MEDLYGKTINKGLAPLDLGKSSSSRPTNFNSLTNGRITPVETNNKSARQQSAFSGRLTPIDTSLSSSKGGARVTTGHAGHVSGHVYSSANGLLNVSSHNSSKLSSSNSGSNVTKTTVDLSHHELNSTQISPISARERELGARRPLVDSSHNSSHAANSSHVNGGLNLSRNTETLSRTGNRERQTKAGAGNVSNLMVLTTESGVKEMIQSLGLLCLVSLLLALGSLVFLLKILPSPPVGGVVKDQFLASMLEVDTVYHVTVAMCALTLSLNLSCLLVCAIQFLFAAKLVKSPNGRLRTSKYLKKAAITRTCAIAGFFISIPLFLIGIVLFTFLHFNETPAIVTSVVIGLGIVFCGGAVIHNVFIWQREKTTLRKGSTAILNGTLKDVTMNKGSRSVTQSHIVLPHATLDLSNGFNGTITAKSLELSTLV